MQYNRLIQPKHPPRTIPEKQTINNLPRRSRNRHMDSLLHPSSLFNLTMVKSPLNMQKKKHLLKITCPDKAGIVAELSTAIFRLGGFIVAFDQFSDPDTNQFFMRAVFESEHETPSIQKELSPILTKFQITFELRDLN